MNPDLLASLKEAAIHDKAWQESIGKPDREVTIVSDRSDPTNPRYVTYGIWKVGKPSNPAYTGVQEPFIMVAEKALGGYLQPTARYFPKSLVEAMFKALPKPVKLRSKKISGK